MIVVKLLLKNELTIVELSLWLTVGCASIAGHIFPVFLNFKGGKGVATSLGVVIGLYPYCTIPGLITFAVWIIFVLIWRYISLASIVAVTVFPITLLTTIIVNPQWKFANLWPLIVIALVLAAVVIVRHVENIKRLLEGSESKIWQRK